MNLQIAVWQLGCGAVRAAASCTNSTPGTHDADVAALKDTESLWVKDAATKDLEKFVAHYQTMPRC